MSPEIRDILEAANAKLQAEFTRIMARLFEDRQSGDYDIAHSITQDEARQDVNDARKIVEAIRAHLESSN